jgi:hypothetical protein
VWIGGKIMGLQDRIGILVGCTELSTVIQLEIKEMKKK